MSRICEAIINRKALQHNLQQVRNYARRSAVMSVIKANAYGHGSVEVAQSLAEYTDSFAVASIDEALTLRRAGIKTPIVLLEGFFHASELAEIDKHYFEIVIHNQQQLAILKQSQLKRPITIWLKVDTGMHRLGFLPEEIPDVWRQLHDCRHVNKPVRLLTHFAGADEPNHLTLKMQLNCFNEITRCLRGPCSLANSAAILTANNTHADWVRPGIMLYGASPFLERPGNQFNLQPVMTLRAKIIAIKHYCQGEAIGYNSTYICPQNMPVGVISIGYGDGYPRAARTGTPVLVRQKIVTTVGRVSMDMITIDLRECPEAQVDDDVILWGEGLPSEKVALCANTICNELFCNVSTRVTKRYV